MTTFINRRNGALLGSLTADALSLGVHWIYDTEELAKKFGYVDSFQAPGTDSYHPKKEAGEQGHVGDQALQLAQFLSRKKEWDKEAFMQDWLNMWPGYSDYFDHATKTVLANVEDGASIVDAASSSNELAGPARIAPLIAFLAEKHEEEAVSAAIEQTKLTHDSPDTIEASAFLAIATYRLIHGGDLIETIEATAPKAALEKAKFVLELEPVDAIAQLGQSCPSEKALPGVLYFALKYQDDLAKAFSENAMAGGDNCVRGLALGMLLGAYHGVDAIPSEWQNGLKTNPLADLFSVTAD